jgi:hypothetical protein
MLRHSPSVFSREAEEERGFSEGLFLFLKFLLLINAKLQVYYYGVKNDLKFL